METKTIQKTLEVNASKEKVWEILTEQPYLNEWTSAMMPDSKVTGKFEEGEHVIYSDGTNMGVVGEVTIFKPLEELQISIVGEAKNGQPDLDNPDSAKWQGSYDHYRIMEKEGENSCTLEIESAFPAEYYNDFAPGWNKMMEKVKELAENK